MSADPGQQRPESGDGYVGNGLAAAVTAILNDARAALTDPQLSDAEAVHEVRKAFKRWRALLRLLVKPVGAPADQMRAQARDLMRTLSGARDVQAALDALSDLAKGDVAVSSISLATIAERLSVLKADVEQTSLTPDLRGRVIAYLDSAALSVEDWRLDSIGFPAIADGITATYRRARRLLPDDWHCADDVDLHALRRRVVEHRHQMELLEPLWPRLGKMWAQEAQRLRDRLGACQDLAVLQGFMAPHQPLARWRARLAPAIAARRSAHLDAAAKIAGHLFAEKPKAFRERIAALHKVRLAGNE